MESKNSDLSSDLEAEILKNQDLEEDASGKQEELTRARDQIRDLTERLDTLQRASDGNAAAQRQLEEAEARVSDLQKTLDEERSKLEAAKQDYQSDKANLESKLESAQEQVAR